MYKKIGILTVLLVLSGVGCAEKNIKTVQPVDDFTKEKIEISEAIKSASADDSDIDGLTNNEEKTLKTDPQIADTDMDGLSDYDEVKVFKTDPLKSDTDTDGKDDGSEVNKGSNPLAK